LFFLSPALVSKDCFPTFPAMPHTPTTTRMLASVAVASELKRPRSLCGFTALASPVFHPIFGRLWSKVNLPSGSLSGYSVLPQSSVQGTFACGLPSSFFFFSTNLMVSSLPFFHFIMFLQLVKGSDDAGLLLEGGFLSRLLHATESVHALCAVNAVPLDVLPFPPPRVSFTVCLSPPKPIARSFRNPPHSCRPNHR